MNDALTVQKTELQAKIKGLLEQSEAIRGKYAGKAENMSAEEQATWSRILDDMDTAHKSLENVEREERIKASLSQSAGMLSLAHPDGPAADGGHDGDPTKSGGFGSWRYGQPLKTYKDGSLAYRSDGRKQYKQSENHPDDATPEVRLFRYNILPKSLRMELDPQNADFMAAAKAIDEWAQKGGRDARKDLQAAVGDQGGFLVVPQEMVTRLVTIVKDMTYMRQLGTVWPVAKAESLGVPVLDTDLTDASWTTELATGSDDTVAPFSKRELQPKPLAKLIKVSNKLLRQAALDPEAIVMDRFAYRFAHAEETAFMTGSGADQPLGVFTASASGIPTSRDTTATGASHTIAGDDLIATRDALKPQYWRNAYWIAHRQILTKIRQLKDSNNNYIWTPGIGGQMMNYGRVMGGPVSEFASQQQALVGGNPDILLGLPVLMSEYAPSAVGATGDYQTILGDFSFYWIADALDMQIQRLIELYAASNQTGFIGRKETDGMPVLAEAFSRLILA